MKNIVLLSHCILNNFSKVKNNKACEDMSALIEWLLKNKIGLIQLKCPETHLYGLKRWGHVREQFDTVHYRKVSREIIAELIDEVREYLNNNYRLLAVVGIDGSPSCGIQYSCSSKNWGGEISLIQSLDAIIPTDYEKRPGIFMEEMQSLFAKQNIHTKFLAYKRDCISALISDLQKLMQE